MATAASAEPWLDVESLADSDEVLSSDTCVASVSTTSWGESAKWKNFQLKGTFVFEKDSKTNVGSANGIWPPLIRGVCGRQPAWTVFMMMSCTVRDPSTSSREYNLVDWKGSLCLPCKRRSSGAICNWEAQLKKWILVHELCSELHWRIPRVRYATAKLRTV